MPQFSELANVPEFQNVFFSVLLELESDSNDCDDNIFNGFDGDDFDSFESRDNDDAETEDENVSGVRISVKLIDEPLVF